MDGIKWLSDNPIMYSSEDLLNFDDAAVILEKFIFKCDTPFSIGINGYWGSGKTSFMHLIKEKIETKYSSQILRTSWFDTWNYTNEEEIWKILMISLINDLDPEHKNEIDKKKLILSVLNLGLIAVQAYVSNGANLYQEKSDIISNLEGIFKSKRSREESIIQNKIKSTNSFRSDFEKFVCKCLGENGKYVIFIDDLDRINPEKSMDVMESIKIFLSCEKCVFIIGCDYDYLNECFGIKYRGMKFCGEDYLEKIVQITFNVPSLNMYNFNVFLNSCLKSFFSTKEEIKEASDLINICLDKNPRKIKRLINLFSVVYALNERGLDNCLLLKLLCFMERWPEYHKKFLNDLHNGIYTYKKYEQWALPIERLQDIKEYFGVDDNYDDESHMPYDANYRPTSYEEEYKEYVSEHKAKEARKRIIEEEVNEELKSGIKISEEIILKKFLCIRPHFPDRIDKMEPYISLVGSIDLINVKTREENSINSLPSSEKITQRVEELIKLFNEQKVDGKYFNVEGEITLPNKRNIQNPRSSFGHFIIEGWKYILLNEKLDDKTQLWFINGNKEPEKILWIISPWAFTQYVIKNTKKSGDIYLTNYYLLESLLKELKNDKDEII